MAAAAVSGALDFERDAADYYRAAAAKADDPFARQLFEMFSGMCDLRATEIRELAARLESSGRFPEVSTAPPETRLAQFRAEHDRIANESTLTVRGVDVIRKALALRAEAREMYTRLSVKASNPVEKAFFRNLAEEESARLETIFTYLDGLEAHLEK